MIYIVYIYNTYIYIYIYYKRKTFISTKVIFWFLLNLQRLKETFFEKNRRGRGEIDPPANLGLIFRKHLFLFWDVFKQ